MPRTREVPNATTGRHETMDGMVRPRSAESRFARSDATFFPEVAIDFSEAGSTAPTALHNAATNGDAKEIVRLLEQPCTSGLLEESCAGMPPLLYAARAGNFDAVAALLERSANVNARAATSASAWSVHGQATWCAIHAAAHRGDSEMLGLLLDGDACISARATRGTTALHFAACQGRLAARLCGG